MHVILCSNSEQPQSADLQKLEAALSMSSWEGISSPGGNPIIYGNTKLLRQQTNKNKQGHTISCKPPNKLALTPWGRNRKSGCGMKQGVPGKGGRLLLTLDTATFCCRSHLSLPLSLNVCLGNLIIHSLITWPPNYECLGVERETYPL